MGEAYEFNRGDKFPNYCTSCNTFNLHIYHSLNPETVGRNGQVLHEAFHQVNCGNEVCDTSRKIDLPVRLI